MSSDEVEKVNKYADVIKNLGVPTVLLCVLIYGGWRMIQWAGEHIATPIVDRQIKFMDQIEETNRQHAETQKQQADAIGKISDTLESIQQTEQRQEMILEKLADDHDTTPGN